ncbi:MAG: Fe-S cluster biogenesis protein NfuA [Polaribacter sp.]|mgnify:CR=1 FL=1|jgi:Fe-S cluster biogenesis protein NfuA
MSVEEKEELIQKVENALDDVRPHLEVDGGNVELVEITEEMDVMVKWMGNCVNCNMSTMTMRAGIEQSIRSKVPGIRNVEAVNGITI